MKGRIYITVSASVLLVIGGYAVNRLAFSPQSEPISVSKPVVTPQVSSISPRNLSIASNPQLAPSPDQNPPDLRHTGSGAFNGPQWDTGADMRARLQSTLNAEYDRQRAQTGQAQLPTPDHRLKPVGVQ
jgi:hypothetical protein